MAPVNPNIPVQGVTSTNDPSYLNYSRPISEFEGDKSYEAMFRGIGDVASAAIKGADFLVKDYIDTEVSDMVYREREAFTGSLEAQREAVTGRPLNILNTIDPDLKVPGGINTGIGQAGALRTAYDAGKVNQTYYHGRLTAIAKSLRNEYPGYREYIDRKIASITGVDPANAYISNMIQDINAMTSKKDKPLDDALAVAKDAIKDGMPGAAQVYNAMLKGDLSPDKGMTWLNQQRSWEYDLKKREAQRKDFSGSRETNKALVTDDLTFAAAAEASRHFSAVQLSAGLSTPTQINEIIRQAQTGQITLTDDQARQLGNSILAQKSAYIQSMNKRGNEVGPDGRTYIQILGAEGFRKVVEENAANFDRISDAIFKKDVGLAFDNANMVTARIEAYKNGVLTNPSTASIALGMAAINSFGGPEGVKEFSRWFLQKGNIGKYSEALREQAVELSAQPDLRKSGNYTSLREAVTKGKTMGIQDGKYYDSIINLVERIGSKETSDYEKINLAKAAFGSKNQGFLSEFPVDSTDPVSGKQIKGRYSAFRRLTSPDITAEVKRLSKQDPSIWNEYVNWTTNEFATDLFAQEIRTLQTFQADPNVQLGWDSDKHQFLMKFGRQFSGAVSEDPFERAARRAPLPSARYVEAEKAINRLNYGLTGVSQVAKENNSDPNTFILGLLIDLGYDPTKGNPLTLPDQMVKEVSNLVGKAKLKQGK